MNILIPMAGRGDRFRNGGYANTKPLIDIAGQPMIQRAVESVGLPGQYIFIVSKIDNQIEEVKALLKTITHKPIIIEIDFVTDGPASSCLLAKEYINNDTPLVIMNCDQIMKWNSRVFYATISVTTLDGLVVTYNTNIGKNSYVRLDEQGFATEFAEKRVISPYSLNGIHFWKKGSDFVYSAERMIEKNLRTNNEFYVSTTYNELIEDGKKIGIYDIPPSEHWAVGTPEDLERYMRLNHGSL